MTSFYLSFEYTDSLGSLTWDDGGLLWWNRAKIRAYVVIDLLAILEKSLDRAIFLYNFIREVRLSCVKASIAIVHIRKFY